MHWRLPHVRHKVGQREGRLRLLVYGAYHTGISDKHVDIFDFGLDSGGHGLEERLRVYVAGHEDDNARH